MLGKRWIEFSEIKNLFPTADVNGLFFAGKLVKCIILYTLKNYNMKDKNAETVKSALYGIFIVHVSASLQRVRITQTLSLSTGVTRDWPQAVLTSHPLSTHTFLQD